VTKQFTAGCCTDIEEGILNALRETADDVPAISIVERVRDRGVGCETDIKAGIWRLLSRNMIELTSGRSLRLPTESGIRDRRCLSSRPEALLAFPNGPE